MWHSWQTGLTVKKAWTLAMYSGHTASNLALRCGSFCCLLFMGRSAYIEFDITIVWP
jgi:hypothetical protein